MLSVRYLVATNANISLLEECCLINTILEIPILASFCRKNVSLRIFNANISAQGKCCLSHTLSDKKSSDKSVEILDGCRKFCLTKNFVRRKFCPIFQYKSQAKIGQKCRNFGLVSKILSDEIFCPSKILSDEILSDKVFDYTFCCSCRWWVESPAIRQPEMFEIHILTVSFRTLSQFYNCLRSAKVFRSLQCRNS